MGEPAREGDLPRYDISVVCFPGGRKARLVVHCGLDDRKGVMLTRTNVVELIDALNTALARMVADA